ncbi:MAG: prolyl aminopeptidase, partial [Ilumatobacteraceae bacterium]
MVTTGGNEIPGPYDSSMLDVGDGNQIYWEACGNPDGKPLVNIHGGPGSGTSIGARRAFDPITYRSILFDQRGCGRSTPHASDPATNMSVNTTHHLIADLERLRQHLGVERWLVHGGSWGCTLALAYAQRFPERVSEMVLVSITTTRRSEIEWLYHGVGRFFPKAWQTFVDGVPEAAAMAPSDMSSGNIEPVLAAYTARMGNADPDVRAEAAADWTTWEDAVISIEPNGTPGAYSARIDRDRDAFVRICATYFANGAWLEEGQLLANMGRLAGIPGVLIHGRFDLGGPVHIAHEVHAAWPGSQLFVI